ncbi:MAG: hypothetical protein JXB35_14810, partial [Anaerolineae bacterium]|nr:hypothetical protein [Anaerolineae bacterium]
LRNRDQPDIASHISDQAGVAHIAKDSRYLMQFEQICELVHDNYVYPDFNGVAWDQVCIDFRPLVAMAPDDEAFWLLMQDLIGRLEDRHSIYLSPAEVFEEEQAVRGDLNYVGIGIYSTVPENAAYGVVLLTFPDSPAEQAGIRAHDRILSIEGLPTCCTPDGFDNLDLLSGPEGSMVTLTIQTPESAPRTISVTRARIATQLPVLTRPIHSGEMLFGYVLIPTFWDMTIAERTREAITGLLETYPVDGLILDLRINGGGIYTELESLLALFISGPIGSFQHQGGTVETLDIASDPIGETLTLPLAVLIGPMTESYAEVFSSALQERGRAILIGQPTAGNVEGVYPHGFKDGSRLWLAEESFVRLDGSSFEGAGLTPDIHVNGRWEEIPETADPYVEAACTWLHAP